MREIEMMVQNKNLIVIEEKYANMPPDRAISCNEFYIVMFFLSLFILL